jgi:3-oxoacyl-[acyl-carrier protein] reductase
MAERSADSGCTKLNHQQESGDKPMRVKNKSIIVTGAGNGIGEGIAKRLAAAGAQVIVNDINVAMGEAVVAAIIKAGGTASFFKADVTQSADVKALVAAAISRYGRLDVMVNNAGWTHRNQPALDVSEDDFDKCYAINVKSIYLSTIHATPVFRTQGGGSFINIASTAGVRPRPGLTWYNGSKGAVITTSKSLAAELGPDNIRVNCINPVFNPDTGLSAEFAGGPVDEDRKAKFRASIPLGRFSTALDVANAALYLASDEADFISGVCIEVDGARCV